MVGCVKLGIGFCWLCWWWLVWSWDLWFWICWLVVWFLVFWGWCFWWLIDGFYGLVVRRLSRDLCDVFFCWFCVRSFFLVNLGRYDYCYVIVGLMIYWYECGLYFFGVMVFWLCVWFVYGFFVCGYFGEYLFGKWWWFGGLVFCCSYDWIWCLMCWLLYFFDYFCLGVWVLLFCFFGFDGWCYEDFVVFCVWNCIFYE